MGDGEGRGRGEALGLGGVRKDDDVATSTFGCSQRIPSLAITEIEENPVFGAYWAHFCVDFDDPNINLKGLLCIF